MITLSSVIYVSAQIIMASRDAIPKIDIQSSCHYMINKAYASDQNEMKDLSSAFEECVSSERNYLQQIVIEWPSTPEYWRIECTSPAFLGSAPSYIIIWSCIEGAKK
jgi:hypothetical protein